ncbi:ETX/MTX2 family pore-forming toxin [Bacillus wiedmannii]|uniref:ETX/MTX2 family pore-forming toxin n=1 Tax=Bacillus wiedmannii TaxID=1890302 RepID=UPI000BF14AA2|nr:ETX/MTX2 family pore-forming toxin [Bacillus wiedmannii]MDP1459984.1 ETX/MTX2 family pore-forming toxin [Bacillus wiedmannii]PEJ74277.1 hypothetical protein CN685_10880 [Bacillus wiedmannii]
MRSITKYKKFLTASTIVCMLGTNIPSEIYALSTSNQNYTSLSTIQNLMNVGQLKKDINERIFDAYKNYWDYPTNLDNVYISGDIVTHKIQYGPASIHNNIHTNVKVDSYKDLDQTNLLTYNNDDGVIEQQANTVETTVRKTETIQYSNVLGIKIGAQTQFKLGIQIPFVTEGGTTLNLSSEFSYAHSDIQTSSHETNITFKSQPVKAAPGGTTIYYGTVKTANFSGEFYGTKASIEKINGVKVSISEDSGHSHGSWDLDGRSLYIIFKYSNKPVPSYIQLDDDNERVILNQNTTFKFTGTGGFYTEIITKFIPKDNRTN